MKIIDRVASVMLMLGALFWFIALGFMPTQGVIGPILAVTLWAFSLFWASIRIWNRSV